jgi:hypothetical protein
MLSQGKLPAAVLAVTRSVAVHGVALTDRIAPRIGHASTHHTPLNRNAHHATGLFTGARARPRPPARTQRCADSANLE